VNTFGAGFGSRRIKTQKREMKVEKARHEK